MKSDWNRPLPEHLPAPSYAPPIVAAGLMLLLWGAVTSWLVSAIGLVVTGFASVLWLGDLRPRGAGTRAGAFAAPLAGPVEPLRTTGRIVLAIGKPVDLATQTPWVYRCALLLAVCALSVVVTGAMITSGGAAASSLIQQAHRLGGALAGILALYLCAKLRGLAWILVLAVGIEALLGLAGRAPLAGALHAFVAQLFFAASVAAALVTSSGWKREPEFAEDMPKVSLRSLAQITVGLVVIQVALGAAVRHKLMGSGLHITFALVVALMIVCVGMLVCNHCAQHGTLRPCSIMMMVITGTQVFLGFGAFIVRMMADENTLPVVITTGAHVTTGALTLAAAVVLAFQLHRNLRVTLAQKRAVVS